jgi:mRNA interferase MazF
VILARGTVVLIELDPTVGHEQRGVRPCIAVSDPAVNADQRFPLIAVVPVTAIAGIGALYPTLSPGPSGLMKASCALVDHVRSIDKRRIRRIFGQVTRDELTKVDEGLELFLGIGGSRVSE